jgi:hypothetical protein
MTAALSADVLVAAHQCAAQRRDPYAHVASCASRVLSVQAVVPIVWM